VTVGYSRAYVRVHYPSDVLLGAALGAGAGLRADGLLRGVAGDRKPATAAAPSPSLPKELVLLVSPHAGRSSGLETARQPSTGLSVVAELEIEAVERLPGLLTGQKAIARCRAIRRLGSGPGR
jgi:hypothetical protein